MKRIIPVAIVTGICIVGAVVFLLSGESENIPVPGLKNEALINEKLEQEENKVIEEMLAKLRKENKRDRAEGIAVSMKDDVENKISFSEEEIGRVLETAQKYLSDKYQRDYHREWYMGANIDPRMSKIYDDSDKGVCRGYDSKNIYIIEFEKERDYYEYLFLVREDSSSDWKVIHEGNGYVDKQS